MTSEPMSPPPEPRDHIRELISAPLVTTFNLKALIDSPQLQQRITLPSGRTVSFATCGSKSGTLVVFFYGLGGSCRQIASMHAQAVRLNIRLLCVDRPGTGYTDPFRPSSSSATKLTSKRTLSEDGINTSRSNSPSRPASIPSDEECSLPSPQPDQPANGGLESLQDRRQTPPPFSILSRSSALADGQSQKRARQSSSSSTQRRAINERVDHSCQEVLSIIDHLCSDQAQFSMMSHSCGDYYVMRMLQLVPERIHPGPISLMAPWVPFSECPETTSRSFKFLKHVPRGLVWAVTSSMNHIGSVILSSSNALSGTKAQLDDDFVAAESKRGKENSGRRRDIDGIEEFLDPYVVQFQEAFDKVLLPALAQDVNRQHSNGYNAEIQMCVADAGFDFADVKVPPGVDIYAYCGHLDTMVPIEASRELGHRCGWDMNEFKYTGHGGPRMLMTALEDYALAIAVTPRRPGSSKGHMRTGNGNAVAIEGTLSTDIVSDTVTVP